MSKVLPHIINAAEIIVGVITLNPSLIIAGTLSEITLLTAKKPKGPAAQADTVQIGEVARSGLFGEAGTAGSLVDAFNFGGKYGTDWTVLVLGLADHRCSALTGIYVNDTLVSFAGDGVVAGYKGQLEVYWRPGTWDQDPPSILLDNCPPFPAGHPRAGEPTWEASDRGRGVSYVVVAYKADKADAKKPVWTSGRPQFLWVLKGALVYSAREDDTVGGDGDHRWDDPATRAWSDNLIDCRYTWVRGLYAGDKVDEPGMLLLGRGLTALEAPPANVFAPANVCDENVALKAGGTEKRYRANGVFSADQAYIDVEQMFAAACGGVILERDGAVEIEPGQAKSTVWEITDDDLIVGSTVTSADFPSRADDNWVNTVSVRYYEPGQKYKEHTAPVRRLDSDVIADAGPRESTPTLSLVTSGTQAQRVGEMMRRQGRLWRTRGITLPPRLAGAEHGDWLIWRSRRYGARGSGIPAIATEGGDRVVTEDGGAMTLDSPAALLFRIESDQLGANWQPGLALREISSSVYAWDPEADEKEDQSVAVNAAKPGDIGAPAADAWVFSTEEATGDGTTGVLLVWTGASDDTYAEAILFEYAAGTTEPDPDDDAAWTIGNTGTVSTTRAEVSGVLTGTTYWGAVSYRVDGERGDRRVFGPVVTASGTGSAGRVAAEDGGRVLGEDGSQIIQE